MLSTEVCDFITEINKYRTGYGELSKIVERIQTQFEESIVEIYRKMDVKMSAVEDFTEEMRDTKYPHLRVATGGKGPPEGPTDNWLAEYEVGTTFVSKSNTNDVDFNLYYVLYKDLPDVVLLKWQLPDGKVLDYYVDPVIFSKKYPKRKILSVIKPEEHRKDAEVSDDEQRNRTDTT